mmetsp:Transcript_52512/g.151328  ORF Transcript_52512/g.151328 Transcript_52512/m.151328 type:complete len:266 (+) Transcript_52512:69-866(+)
MASLVPEPHENADTLLLHDGEHLEVDVEEGAHAGSAPVQTGRRFARTALFVGCGLLGVTACALASPGSVASIAAFLPMGLVAKYDPLSSAAAGIPGMPMGVDEGSAGALADATECRMQEELYGGLCYKKCAILTNGTFTKRVAPNGCCKEMSVKCVLSSEVDFSGLFPGSGYNINVDGQAPHGPGICDGNEEFFGGVCYKKCSLLTQSAYTVRSGPGTCCTHSCWNALNTVTKAGECTGFNVGGGLVPQHNCPHAPTRDEAAEVR